MYVHRHNKAQPHVHNIPVVPLKHEGLNDNVTTIFADQIISDLQKIEIHQ